MICPAPPDVVQWAPVASAGCAAVAALVALVSVRQARSIWIADKQPRLTIWLIEEIHSGELSIHVHNGGGGRALNVQIYVVEGSHACLGVLPPDGLLLAGEDVALQTGLRAGTPSFALVACVDAAGRLCAWTHDGRHKRWRPSRRSNGLAWTADRFFKGTVRHDALQIAPFSLKEPSPAQT